MRVRVTVLGCGGAGGVPTISLGWGDCDPGEPRNRRSRPSILVEAQPAASDAPCRRLLIDTSPDLREQLLKAGVQSLDGVLFTHAHADHVHGLDDLREVNRVIRRGLPCWADGVTLDVLHQRFGYAFLGIGADEPIFRPWLIAHRVDGGATFSAAGVPVTCWRQDHGWGETLGFRIGRFAYTTDAVRLDEAAFAAVRGADLWMIGTLTATPHPTHCHVAQALEWAARAGVRRVVLTHLGPGLDYATLKNTLPAHAAPAHDGMILEVTALS